MKWMMFGRFVMKQMELQLCFDEWPRDFNPKGLQIALNNICHGRVL
jgi:hypothetical protein